MPSASAKFTLTLLGEFEITGPDGPIDLSSKKWSVCSLIWPAPHPTTTVETS